MLKVHLCFLAILSCNNIFSINGQIENDNVINIAKNDNHTRTNPSQRSLSNYVYGFSYDVDISTIPGLRPDDDLETWQAPEDFQKQFPFYLSGFDAKQRAIWIAEFGKFNLQKIAHGPRSMQEVFEKFIRQAAYIAIKSQKIMNRNNKLHNFIIDFEGLRLEQVSDPVTVAYTFDYARRYRRFFEKNIAKMVVVNVNPVTEVLINLARPLFARILHRVESYGTNKEQWIPQLLKSFPADQLPEWYGGSPNHKPIYVLG